MGGSDILLGLSFTKVEDLPKIVDVIITSPDGQTNEEPRRSFKGLNSQVSYSRPDDAALVGQARDAGETASTLTGASITGNPVLTAGLFVIIALDPTGFLIRLIQILKIINKLYFININYGRRLDAFFNQLSLVVTSSNTSKDLTTIKSKKFRGRLSEKSVPLSIF